MTTNSTNPVDGDVQAQPVAWAHRLVNKRNGTIHPWVYGSNEKEPSEGDIFRVEVKPLYDIPSAQLLRPVELPDETAGVDWKHRSEVAEASLNLVKAQRDLELERNAEQEAKQAELYAEIYKLREELKGPDGFATWKDAALHKKLSAKNIANEIDYLTAMSSFHSNEWHKMDPITGYMKGWNAHCSEVQRLNATAQPVSDGCKVPEGWKLVPIEPTDKMINAALESGSFTFRTAYAAMLAAAPGGQDEQ